MIFTDFLVYKIINKNINLTILSEKDEIKGNKKFRYINICNKFKFEKDLALL